MTAAGSRTDTPARKPWAFVATKDGYWAGVCTSTLPKSELKSFLGEFAAEGFSIVTVYDREGYEQMLATHKFWHDSPEWKAKYAGRSDPGDRDTETGDLFA